MRVVVSIAAGRRLEDGLDAVNLSFLSDCKLSGITVLGDVLAEPFSSKRRVKN